MIPATQRAAETVLARLRAPSLVAKITRTCARLDLGRLERAALAYAALWTEPPGTHGEIQASLIELRALIWRLDRKLSNLSEGVKGRLCFADEFEDGAGIDRARLSLSALKSMIQTAENRAPARSDKRNFRVSLVQDLACLVADAGHEVSEKASSPLVRLTGIVLDACGDRPSGVRRIVTNALKM